MNKLNAKIDFFMVDGEKELLIVGLDFSTVSPLAFALLTNYSYFCP